MNGDLNDTHGKEAFLAPKSKYRGKFTPQNLVFNANLQEFAQRVNYICALETNGKISAEQAHEEIRHLWHRLNQSKQELLNPEE